jgi:hypothetical protein
MPAGGKREGSGRPTGSLNKATAEIKALAAEYGPAAIVRLAEMSGLTKVPPAESEQTRLGAIRELLDRGYGKAPQALTGADGGVLQVLIEVITGVPRANDADDREETD